MARAPRVSVPPAPRANTPAPASRRTSTPPPVLKGARVVSTGPSEGQSRVRNGVRQVYRNGKWTNVGRLRATRPSSPGGVPVAPRLTAPEAAAPPAAPAPVAPPSFTPTSSWWSQQFTADPRYMTSAPVLEGRRTQIGQAYGFTIARNDQGLPLYKSAGGATGITQGFDDNGAIVYKDSQGNTYKPSELQLDIRRVGPGEAGYLEGAFGGAEAGSERRQFEIGDVAAQAGIRRSGMRGQAGLAETAALQAALAGLTGRSAAELAGVETDYAQLYREIYGDLAKKAEELAAAQPVAAEVPAEAPAEAPAAPSGAAPVAGGGTVNPAGQYTPPPASGALSMQAFNNTLNEILGPPSQRGPQPMTGRDRVRALRNVYDNYQLTPAQRRRVKAELKKLGFVVA